jgi:hypothetical protein
VAVKQSDDLLEIYGEDSQRSLPLANFMLQMLQLLQVPDEWTGVIDQISFQQALKLTDAEEGDTTWTMVAERLAASLPKAQLLRV